MDHYGVIMGSLREEGMGPYGVPGEGIKPYLMLLNDLIN